MAFGTIALRAAEKLAPPSPQRPSIGISFSDTVHGQASQQLTSTLLSGQAFATGVCAPSRFELSSFFCEFLCFGWVYAPESCGAEAIRLRAL